MMESGRVMDPHAVTPGKLQDFVNKSSSTLRTGPLGHVSGAVRKGKKMLNPLQHFSDMVHLLAVKNSFEDD